jgi:hypothetical protein
MSDTSSRIYRSCTGVMRSNGVKGGGGYDSYPRLTRLYPHFNASFIPRTGFTVLYEFGQCSLLNGSGRSCERPFPSQVILCLENGILVFVPLFLADLLMVDLALLLVDRDVLGLVVRGALFHVGSVALLLVLRVVDGVAARHVYHVTLKKRKKGRGKMAVLLQPDSIS